MRGGLMVLTDKVWDSVRDHTADYLLLNARRDAYLAKLNTMSATEFLRSGADLPDYSGVQSALRTVRQLLGHRSRPLHLHKTYPPISESEEKLFFNSIDFGCETEKRSAKIRSWIVISSRN